jgi:hypothetical protein
VTSTDLLAMADGDEMELGVRQGPPAAGGSGGSGGGVEMIDTSSEGAAVSMEDSSSIILENNVFGELPQLVVGKDVDDEEVVKKTDEEELSCSMEEEDEFSDGYESVGDEEEDESDDIDFVDELLERGELFSCGDDEYVSVWRRYGGDIRQEGLFGWGLRNLFWQLTFVCIY